MPTAATLLFSQSRAVERFVCPSAAERLGVASPGILRFLEGFNPNQPRNPKGAPGGGRFRSMAEHLKEILKAHHERGGKGDPFEGFSREQLRRVAKARGLELSRGESRDSIAKKLHDHLAGPGPSPIAEDLSRWRADATKPGRIKDTGAAGPTKREEYVASWERGIAHTRKELKAADAAGRSSDVQRLKGILQYQSNAMKAIRDKEDPSLDEPASGLTHKLAGKVNQKRPLAVYGDMLHLDAADDAWIRLNMTELEKIPADLHGTVAEHMAKRETGGIWIGEGGVSGLDHSHDLARQQPRGWGGSDTFDDVNGVYRPHQRVMLVGRTANSEHRGGSTSSHEFGHALDDALGEPSAKPDWEALHARVIRESPHLNPYYKQAGDAGAQEFWAEAFSAWTQAREKEPGISRDIVYAQRLNVSFGLGGDIEAYFDHLLGVA